MIVTSRAAWILLVALGGIAWGIAARRPLVAQLGLGTLLWLIWEWFALRYNLARCWPHVQARRQLLSESGPVTALWQHRAVDVHTELLLPATLPRMRIHWRDEPPAFCEVEGAIEQEVLSGGARSCQVRYRLQSPYVGWLQWNAVTARVTDSCQLFQARRSIPVPLACQVLPPLMALRNADRLHKRLNRLPPPGHHRHGRPGMGSELLEIREYVPGDSPRSIAWKLSARRDVLMTKQYESEVPIRTTLIVDAGPQVRWQHPYPSAYATFVQLAGLIAETLIANRDSIGLGLLEADRVELIAATSRRQTALRIVRRMMQSLRTPCLGDPVPLEALMPFVLALIARYYPEMVSGPLSQIPVGWFTWSWRRRSAWTQRYQVCLFVAGCFRLSQFQFAQLLRSDEPLVDLVQRLLHQHGYPFVGPLFDESGRPTLHTPDKPRQLARILTHAVSRARDNELFVLMADLAETGETLGDLEKAIKMAVAKRHRVMLLSAWPPHLAVPEPQREAAEVATARTSPLELLSGSRLDPRKLRQLASNLEVQSRWQAYERLKRRLARLRVPVAPATVEQAPRLILEQIELLRLGRRSR